MIRMVKYAPYATNTTIGKEIKELATKRNPNKEIKREGSECNKTKG